MFLHSYGHAKQGVQNITKCSRIFTIQGNVTGVMCMVVTPKDKERHPRPLTKQNAKQMTIEVTCRVVTSKDKKRNPSPFTRKYEEKKFDS